MSDVDELSLAILRAAHLDPDKVVSLRYEHRVTEVPILTVEYYAWNADTAEIDAVSAEYEITIKAKPMEETE